MTDVTIEYTKNHPEKGFDLRTTYDDDKVMDYGRHAQLYWHVYRAVVQVEQAPGVFSPLAFVACVGKSPLDNHEDIPEDKVPQHTYAGEKLDFHWVKTLTHEPSQEEWDGFFAVDAGE